LGSRGSEAEHRPQHAEGHGIASVGQHPRLKRAEVGDQRDNASDDGPQHPERAQETVADSDQRNS
jgi:hypothetical protein